MGGGPIADGRGVSSLSVVPPASPSDLSAVRRFELRVENVVNRKDAPNESCQVAQVDGAALDFVCVEGAGGSCRCGAGAYTGIAPRCRIFAGACRDS
jgi:hypothetical protein